MRTADFIRSVESFEAFGTHTRLEEFHWSSSGRSGTTMKAFNEYWTSGQRQAHSLHEISYRACFKPQLPQFFISRLSKPGDAVYDPFMGRGTTPLEAHLLGRKPLGNDINPLSLALVDPPLHGMVERFDPDPLDGVDEEWFRYIATDPDYNGPDEFTYHVADSFGLFSDDDTSWNVTSVGLTPTTVTITVLAVNDPPTGEDAGFSCDEIGCATTIVGPENLVVVDPADYVDDIDSTVVTLSQTRCPAPYSKMLQFPEQRLHRDRSWLE